MKTYGPPYDRWWDSLVEKKSMKINLVFKTEKKETIFYNLEENLSIFDLVNVFKLQ